MITAETIRGTREYVTSLLAARARRVGACRACKVRVAPKEGDCLADRVAGLRVRCAMVAANAVNGSLGGVVVDWRSAIWAAPAALAGGIWVQGSMSRLGASVHRSRTTIDRACSTQSS